MITERLLRAWCALVVVAGAAKAAAALAAVVVAPELAVHRNAWGIPAGLPLGVALWLAACALLASRRRAVFDAGLGALWGAGAWAFATATLLAAGWPAGIWWALLVGGAPPVVWLLSVELAAGWRALAAPALLAIAAGLIGSLATSTPAVHAAAVIAYTALPAAAWWTACGAHHRRPA